jgi:hypothetical protein
VLDVSLESTAFGVAGTPLTPPTSSDPVTGDSVVPVGSVCLARGFGEAVRVLVGLAVGVAVLVGEGVGDGLSVGSTDGGGDRTQETEGHVGVGDGSKMTDELGSGSALAATDGAPAAAVPGRDRARSGSATRQAADARARNRAGDVGTARW